MNFDIEEFLNSWNDMSKSADRLLENTVDTVFQNMDDFYLPNEYNKFTMSLKLAFPKFSKGFSASDFDQFIEKVVGPSNVVSLGRLSYPNEWQMQVSCSATREKLIREYSKVKINGRSCTISPLSQSEVRGFVSWVPSQIPNSELEVILEKFGEVLFIENQKFKFKLRGFENGKSVLEAAKAPEDVEKVSDSRYFGLFLRSGQTVEDIPYFIMLCGRRCFVSIPGRSPLCFHCKIIGHLKKECRVYSQRLNSYCNRKPTGVKRRKPRGRRYKPSLVTNAQEVDTDTGIQTKPQVLVDSINKLNLKSDEKQVSAKLPVPPIESELEESSPLTLSEDDTLPLKILEDDTLPLKILEDDTLPLKILEDDTLPLKISENDSIPLKMLENDESTPEKIYDGNDKTTSKNIIDFDSAKPNDIFSNTPQNTGAKSKKKKNRRKKRNSASTD